jgi:hypothetical protein
VAPDSGGGGLAANYQLIDQQRKLADPEVMGSLAKVSERYYQQEYNIVRGGYRLKGPLETAGKSL